MFLDHMDLNPLQMIFSYGMASSAGICFGYRGGGGCQPSRSTLLITLGGQKKKHIFTTITKKWPSIHYINNAFGLSDQKGRALCFSCCQNCRTIIVQVVKDLNNQIDSKGLIELVGHAGKTNQRERESAKLIKKFTYG